MDEQTTSINEPASGSDAAGHERARRGGPRLARKLLARRVAWRRRVVGSMLAGLAAVAAAQLALGEYAAAAAPLDRGVACATPAMETAADSNEACLPVFASVETVITLGGSR